LIAVEETAPSTNPRANFVGVGWSGLMTVMMNRNNRAEGRRC